MASESDPAPYFEDMFDILSKTPQERLMSLKYKLPVDRKIDRLLYSAVLFFLNEKEKAVLLVSDDKEQKCQSAVYILNKIQGTEQGANSKFGWDNLTPEDLAVRVDLARIFTVLSQENLCDVEFWDLLDESRRQCDANRPFLKSLDENSLSTRSGSDCRSRVETDNLKSKAKGPAERGLVPSTSQSASFHINNTASNLPREEHSANSRNTTGTGAQPEEGYSTYSPVKNSSAVGVKPIECTEETDSNQIVTSKTSTQDQDHLNSNLSDPHPTQNATLSEDPQSSRPRMNISEETEENVENKFYPFVILHADEDQEIAEKVRKSLEELGVMEGATFCEDFSLPGKCPISCIQDAVDNSAFTILLLTNNFNTHWTELKTNIVLMNSIQNKHKYNTVIPMLTKENRLPKRKIPFALQAINQLDETSKHFERHVAKTFEPAKLRTYKDKWLVEQKLQQIETQKAKVAKDRKDLRDITRLTQQLGQNLQNYQKEGQHLASLRQYFLTSNDMPKSWPQPSCIPYLGTGGSHSGH
uniref:TIR domain-containing protein n=1 Tax=Callorhinchus milii TaxID=7868 RepID=A0A4W3K648_CALMI